MSVSFSDIYAMLATRGAAADVPACAYTHMMQNLAEQGVTLPNDSAEGLNTLARLQQKPWPTIQHPRVALYASAYENGATETRQAVAALATNQDAVARLCARANADLRVYELDVEDGVKPNLSEIEAAHALSYGLMTVEEKVDYLIVGSISKGADVALAHWLEILASDSEADLLQSLCDAGARHDLFALVGAIMAARMAGIPIGCGTQLQTVLNAVLPRLFGNEPSPIVPSCSAVQAGETVDALMTVLNLQNIAALVALPSGGKAILPQATKAA